MPEETEELEKKVEEAELRPCSILEYKWASTYSDDMIYNFGKRNLISADCAATILSERERKRGK